MVTNAVHLTGFAGGNGGTQSDPVAKVDVPEAEFGSAGSHENQRSWVIENPQTPSQLRERAAGIRWVVGFVRDDWRVHALHLLADQLQEAAMLLEREEETYGNRETKPGHDQDRPLAGRPQTA
jgi:hypothetical protein